MVGHRRTALYWASSTPGGLDVVQFLLDQKGVEVDKSDASGWTALHIAASAGREDVVQELLGAGAGANKPNDKGLTPLDWQIGKLLISRRAEINAKDRANQHPLHRAATTGSTGFITLLLNPPEGSPKTRLNTADRIGNTPLHLAMESAHAEAAVLLIQAGADRHRLNQDGQAPEEVEGVFGPEQKRARDYVIDKVGKP